MKTVNYPRSPTNPKHKKHDENYTKKCYNQITKTSIKETLKSRQGEKNTFHTENKHKGDFRFLWKTSPPADLHYKKC